jgi:hypothetical protein
LLWWCVLVNPLAMAYNTMAAMMYGQQLKTITRPNEAMIKQGIQSLS